MTRILSPTPICGAASPMPGAAYIVWTMSSIRRRMSSVTASTRRRGLHERGVAVLENRADHGSPCGVRVKARRTID